MSVLTNALFSGGDDGSDNDRNDDRNYVENLYFLIE